MEIWIVKHLSDLRSGKPETDVKLFTFETSARDHIKTEHEDHGFLPWDLDEAQAHAEDFRINVWFRGDADSPDEFVELEGPVGVNTNLTPSTWGWLEQKCMDEVGWVKDYAQTRKDALDWVANIDEVMAFHNMSWPDGETAVQWATKETWPDDPSPPKPVEAMPTDDPIDGAESEWPASVTNDNSIDDTESDGVSEWPEGSGG